MKQRKKLGGKLLALLLVLCIGVSLFPVAPVLAQEEDSQSAVEASVEPADGAEEPAPAENQPEAAEAYLEDTTGGETSADLAISEENTAEGETPVVVSPVPEGSAEEAGSAVDSTTAPGQPEDSVAEEDSLAEDMPEGIDALDDVDGETLAPSEADAFRLDVTFAGQTLQEKHTNAISGAWDVTTAQSLNVVLKRDTTVKIDETKQYVLCLKVSEGFSFDKLPEIDKLDGVQDMAFVQNKASGDVAVDPYSGEIRIRVNPETETVNLGTVEVTVSDALAAAAGTGLTVQSPVRVQLITADASLTLKDMLDSDKTLLHGDSVDSVYLVGTSAPADDQNTGGQNESETAVPDGIEPLDDETGSEVVTPRTVDETNAFNVSVSFAGQELTKGGTNAITDEWSGNSSKVMQVTITRNKSYDVDPNKQYVLCMKTSDVFYFNGLPDVSTITGAEDVAMVKNETPKINVVGKTQDLTGFSPYSGEIRVKLNPAVDVITIADIGVSYNSALMGYTGGEQTVTDPVDVQLISVDASETLSGFKDTNKVSLQDFPVSTLKVKTEKVGGGLRTFNSIDDFKSNTFGADAKLNVDDGISYVLGSQKQKEMVYGTLTCVLHVPYILVNGEKEYLQFDENDTAITNNQKGTSIGYPMKSKAVYDAVAHTITYTFENVYMVSWSNFAYTPTFRWPDGVEKNITADCNVEGYVWEISEQKTFTGATGSISKSSTAKGTVFRPNQADIKLMTDVNNPSNLKLAKPMIYTAVNRKNGISGFLGYFDVHNEGAGDSPKVNVKIEFNTSDGSGAKYYVTQVQIPADQAKTTVTYTLVDDSGTTVTGTYPYNNTTSFSCKVGELRQKSRVGDNYFIQSLEYQTILRRNKYYHTDVTHNYRNVIGTPGSYQGYIEGDVGKTASAQMTISAVEENGKITSDGKSELTATEISTISELDFISTGIYGATLDNQSSANITAGSSTKLQFSILVGTEEYGLSDKIGTAGPSINGYHVLRDGIFYACLPEGVSILGADQVKVEYSRKSIPATSVQVLENTKCTVNGATAYWWKIVVPQMNVNAFVSATATISIDLATSESMAGVSWNFNDCLALGTNGQKLSRVNDSFTNGSNTVAGLTKLNLPSANGLVKALDTKADNLGINLYRSNSSVILNIARAEAKLDVTTALSVNDTASANDQVTVSDKNTKITYAVTVTGQESGAAKDFDYYIPIVHTDSTLDTGALVSQKEIGLQLSEAVQITSVGGTAVGELPFEVSYTTDSGLNSTTIQGNTVKWVDTLTDYSKVTAVKISTRPNARVNEKEAYRFDVVMQYDNTASDFDRQAGSVAHWRSFGHYTYVRNGASTTNSYPSASNSVKIRYVKDLTGTPMTMTLDTAAATNSVDTVQMLGTTFVKDQKLSIKAVTPSSGTQLISDDPKDLTGADANSKFKVSFNINNGATSAVTLPSVHSAWSIPANTNVNLQTKVFFSKALTDVTTERYVDLVLGNDDVDITCRVKLERKVAAATAADSGVAVGEQFQVPQVAKNCSISRDSAFTALYVVKNFVPGNYSSQLLKWRDSGGADCSFPAGTTITMMEVNENSQITGYWYCKPSGSSVDLRSFTRMAGTENYSYDTSATAGTTLRYLFVVNFGQASASAGSYQLAFDATAKAGVTAFTPVAPGVTLGATKGYGLSATTTADVLNPTAELSYTVTDASGNDSYTEGKSLSLVLTPQNAAALPQDARIQVGDQTYSCNGKNEIIIPIGTIAAGSKPLTLTSKMFPEEEKTYSFTAKLYLSNSAQADAPINGKVLCSCDVTFTKTAENRPALSVTGTRVATVSDWVSGQTIDIQMKNLDDCDVTVKVYSGVSGTTQVTDLVSSVSGIFTMNSGTGVYNKGTPTGKLVLNSAAKAGTYRLSFEVSKAGKVLLTVPYYVIVR